MEFSAVEFFERPLHSVARLELAVTFAGDVPMGVAKGHLARLGQESLEIAPGRAR